MSGAPLIEKRVERRLAAVLAADVAGYSRLMGADEEGTLARLKEVRKTLVDPTIAKHRGRIVKTTGDGMLYVATGSQGEANRPLFAIKPGASGDISLKDGESSNAFVAWYQPRASAYTSSPLVFGGRVYAVNDNGVMAVFDAKDGREIYKARVGGAGNTFSASPWAYGGKVFCLSEDGDTFVLNPADQYDEVAKNSLGEMTLATPAVTRDGVFVRTATSLYRIR